LRTFAWLSNPGEVAKHPEPDRAAWVEDSYFVPPLILLMSQLWRSPSVLDYQNIRKFSEKIPGNGYYNIARLGGLYSKRGNYPDSFWIIAPKENYLETFSRINCYSDSIRKQMRAHNKTLEPLKRGDRGELRAISGGSA
jgi:hypothetical protein